MTLLLSLIILISILLVLVILAQNSKGGGLTSQFGGSGASNMIGVKKTGDLLEKLTWGFIIAIFALSIGTNLVDNTGNGGTDPFIDRAQEEQVTPALDLGGVEESTDDAGSESLEDLSGSDSIN
ncbi:preprotein translocase subunit SecG [Fulvivirga sp.]|jgi:preprotein translocase subunit SecG|uniref:preprotein translocase subunit SecG n=1 Tax=Fulvivirga sp. TaxID=1931237 RepID=UPI0032EBB742